MTIRRYFLPLIMTVLLVLLSACGDLETEEIKFKVIAYNNNFSGSYSIDSGSLVSFAGSSIGNSVYSYEKEVELEDQIEIEASPGDATGDEAVTSLEIKVYKDGSLVKSIQDSDSEVTTVSLTYTYGETADTE